MRTYQLVMKGGLTKNIEADSYRKHRGYLVFRLNGRIVYDVKSSDVVMVDELAPAPRCEILEMHAI